MAKRLKSPKAQKIRISALTTRQEIRYRSSLDAVKLIRDGRAKSLTQAARESGTTPRTVKRYAGSAFSKRGDKYVVRPSDRLRRELTFYDSKGTFTLVTHSSRQATQIAKYHNAIRAFAGYGDDGALRAFIGKSIAVHGKSYPFLTDRKTLNRLGRAGELHFLDIYSSDGGS